MCFQRKKSAEKEQAKPKAQPNPGNTEPTQAATPKKPRARPVQQVVIAMEPENEQKPRKREKPRKERRREDSDNTLEDIPSLMPEIELELLRERDQQVTDSQLL